MRRVLEYSRLKYDDDALRVVAASTTRDDMQQWLPSVAAALLRFLSCSAYSIAEERGRSRKVLILAPKRVSAKF